MLKDKFCIDLSKFNLEDAIKQISEAIVFYQKKKTEDIFRLTEGIVDWPRKVLIQKLVLSVEQLTSNDYFEYNMSEIGSPSIRAFDFETGIELDINVRRLISQKKVCIKLDNGFKGEKVTLEIENKLSTNLIQNMVEVEKNVTRKEFFGFKADIILRNNTEYYIKDFYIKLETEPIELDIVQIKLNKQIKKLTEIGSKAKKDAKIRKLIEQKENQLIALIDKYKEIDYHTMTKMLFKGKKFFTILKHDPAFPMPRPRAVNIASIDNAGELDFDIDLKPGATFSYQIIGPELTEVLEEEMRILEQKRDNSIKKIYKK